MLDRHRFVIGSCAAACFARIPPQAMHGQEKSSPVWSAMQSGASGNGRDKDTKAIQRAIDECAKHGGGRVTLDSGGTFLSGSLVLRPSVELHLAAGSVLLASPDREDYHEYGSLLFAKDCNGVHVSGTGAIDGNFTAFFAPKGPQGYAVPQPFLGPYDPLYGPDKRNPADGRPRMVLLVNCQQVLLEQATIRRAPTWTVHLIGCEGVRITGISILNDLDVPNCDGIDLDHCRNVRVEGCHIVAGDDCLVLKASRNFGKYGPCEGITITNCTLESSSAGIKVEPEGPYPVRSAVISDCSILRSNRGISILNRDGASVEALLFTGLVIETRMRPMMWWGSGEPIAVSSVPRQKGDAAGVVRDVQFSNILCRGESGIYLRGSSGAPLENIQLSNIDVVLTKTTDIPGGFHDMRPGDTFGQSGLDRRDVNGVFASEVAGLTLAEIGVHWGPEPPAYFGSALELEHCREVSLHDVAGKAAHPDRPPAIFRDTTYVEVVSPQGAEPR